MSSEAGFGILQGIVLATIVVLIGVAVAEVGTTMLRESQKINMQNTWKNTRQHLINTIQNSNAWGRTVSDATNTQMSCLAFGGLCANNVWYPLTLRDSSNTIVFSQHTGTDGISDSGGRCTTWDNAFNPDASCAMSYDLEWRALCPDATDPCARPVVEVRGRPKFSSSDRVLGGGFNTDSANANLALRSPYFFQIQRGSAIQRDDPVIASFIETDNSGEGNGNCVAAPVIRKLNTVELDPARNILNGTGSGTALSPADQIQLRPGTYNCRIIAPGYKMGGNRIRLYSTAGTNVDLWSAMVIAPVNGGSSIAIIDTTLTLNQATTLVISHTCSSRPSDDTDGFGDNNLNFTFGVPQPNPGTVGTYTQNIIYTRVSCLRSN